MLSAGRTAFSSTRLGFERILYALAWTVALPLTPLRLLRRARREPGYRRHAGERYGLYARDRALTAPAARAPGSMPAPGSTGGAAAQVARAPIIWIHAVSVGETRATVPLVAALRGAVPGARLLLTHMTASGRDAGSALFGRAVEQAWLPYDVEFAVERFLDRFRPSVGLLVETEVWPTLLRSAKRRNLPMFLVNARLSDRSARRYSRLPALAAEAFGSLAGVAAQSAADAARLRALGAPAPFVTGNIKFDFSLDPSMLALGTEFRARFGTTRPVWVAGSTRDGEESLLLDCMRAAQPTEASLLVLVPRHPQRFDDVARLLSSKGVRYVRRSQPGPVGADVGVVLGDSMGEMGAYYASADVAVVGGGFLPLGGQNLLEPIAAGRPVVVGPHMFNFAEATSMAVQAGAALQVADAAEAVKAVGELLAQRERRMRMAAAGTALLAAHRGCAERLASWLVAELDRRGAPIGGRAGTGASPGRAP